MTKVTVGAARDDTPEIVKDTKPEGSTEETAVVRL